MKTYKITFEDGNTMTTGFNGTLEAAKSYYVGQKFQFGDTEENPRDLMIKALTVTEVK